MQHRGSKPAAGEGGEEIGHQRGYGDFEMTALADVIELFIVRIVVPVEIDVDGGDEGDCFGVVDGC